MASRFSIKAIFEAVDNLTRPLARIEGRVKSALRGTEAAAARATKSLGAAAQQTDRFVSGLSSAAKTVALAGGAAMAVGAASVVTAGANFEEAITAVGAVSLKSRADIAELEKQALALGSSTKFTATQVANGMELM